MKYYNNKLEEWKSSGNLRSLPDVVHRGKWIEKRRADYAQPIFQRLSRTLVPAGFAE